jgi:hypothetical protein
MLVTESTHLKRKRQAGQQKNRETAMRTLELCQFTLCYLESLTGAFSVFSPYFGALYFLFAISLSKKTVFFFKSCPKHTFFVTPTRKVIILCAHTIFCLLGLVNAHIHTYTHLCFLAILLSLREITLSSCTDDKLF